MNLQQKYAREIESHEEFEITYDEAIEFFLDNGNVGATREQLKSMAPQAWQLRAAAEHAQFRRKQPMNLVQAATSAIFKRYEQTDVRLQALLECRNAMCQWCRDNVPYMAGEHDFNGRCVPCDAIPIRDLIINHK